VTHFDPGLGALQLAHRIFVQRTIQHVSPESELVDFYSSTAAA
jgi:hypothetical protein